MMGKFLNKKLGHTEIRTLVDRVKAEHTNHYTIWPITIILLFGSICWKEMVWYKLSKGFDVLVVGCQQGVSRCQQPSAEIFWNKSWIFCVFLALLGGHFGLCWHQHMSSSVSKNQQNFQKISVFSNISQQLDSKFHISTYQMFPSLT